jgi:hypothetical protein
VLVHHVLLVALQVPLFQHMDDLVLENICDRVKSLIFPKGEVVSTRTRSSLDCNFGSNATAQTNSEGISVLI